MVECWVETTAEWKAVCLADWRAGKMVDVMVVSSAVLTAVLMVAPRVGWTAESSVESSVAWMVALTADKWGAKEAGSMVALRVEMKVGKKAGSMVD